MSKSVKLGKIEVKAEHVLKATEKLGEACLSAIVSLILAATMTVSAPPVVIYRPPAQPACVSLCVRPGNAS